MPLPQTWKDGKNVPNDEKTVKELAVRMSAPAQPAFSGRPLALEVTRSRQSSSVDGVLPKQLEHVEQAIRDSEKILQLKDDWDEEGSPGYEFATWKRAAEFVRLHCYKAWRISKRSVPAPIVFPGPDGSIDVHWRTEELELLVNVPADPSKPASFYGDDYADICIKGTVSTSRENHGIPPLPSMRVGAP